MFNTTQSNATMNLLARFASYDVVVVGGGPGGYPAAIRAAQNGLKVACIEKRGTLGGTCLNVGCIPSKALLNATHKYEEAHKGFKSLGMEGGNNVKMNFDNLMKMKNTTVKGLTGGIEFLFKKNKVDYFKGEGIFTEGGKLSVKKADGTTESVDTKNIILATGSVPSGVPGGKVVVDEETIVTSTGALALKKVPKKMIVIGGGVIGIELGSVYQRLGAKVEVVEYLDKICPSLDSEIGKGFQKTMTKQGMKFHLSTKVLSATKKASGGAVVEVETKKGKETLEADVVLVAVGRKPFTDNLGLDKTDIKTDRIGRIETNGGFLASTQNGTTVYAIGDVVEGPMLAHKAEEDGIAVADLIAKGAMHKPDYNVCPQVVYTEPEVAGVGISEDQAKKDGLKYKVAKFPMAANSRARCIGASDGMVKLIFNPDTFELYGGWIMGVSAGDLIHELSVLMHQGRTLKDISTATFAHPTLSEAVMEAAMMAVDGKAIHFA